jgi:hypothetical protein
VEIDGVDIGAVSSYAFNNVTNNHSISAVCSAVCVPVNPSCAASTCTSAQCWDGCNWLAGTQTCSLPCINGLDDDGDGETDGNDPGCHTDLNPNNAGSFEADNDESDSIQVMGLPSVQNVSSAVSRVLRYRVVPDPSAASLTWAKECRLLDYNDSVLYDWTVVAPAVPSEPTYNIMTPATDGVYQYQLECRNVHYHSRQVSGTITLIIGNPVSTGSIGSVVNCEIPDGGNSCTGFVSWETINTISSRLEVVGAGVIPDYYDGLTGINEGFLLPRRGSFAVNLLNTFPGPGPYPILATSTIQAACRPGSAWVGGRCQPGPRITSLSINGASGSYSASSGESLTIAWTTQGTRASTSCQPLGLWGGTGLKDRNGGTYSDTAVIGGSYTLTCSTPGYPDAVASVDLNLSCPVSYGQWSVCGPPCSNGDGTRSRSVTAATCVITVESEDCNTPICRDLNWKEVGQ